jgi:hypothetical protein
MNNSIIEKQMFLICRIESNYNKFMIKTKGTAYSLELLRTCKNIPDKKWVFDVFYWYKKLSSFNKRIFQKKEIDYIIKEIDYIENKIINLNEEDIEEFIQFSLRIALPSLVQKI